MSTFESSSSFVAQAAARTSTRTNGLRKTHNHRALRINTDGIRTPVYNARPYFDASEVTNSDSDSDEEEERILVHLMPVPETLENTTENNNTSTSTSHYICIQLGFLDTICDAFHRAKKTIGGAGAVERRIVSAITILAIFFMLVMFGGSVATTTTSSSNHHLGAFAPSGRASMRIAAPLWAPPPQANDDILAAVNIDTPPSTVRAAARAPSYTTKPKRSVPAPAPAEPRAVKLPPQQPREVVPISPSQFARAAAASAPAADVVVRAPSGTASAKFRLLYVYGEEQAEEEKREEPRQEHGHPDDLADLFNGGRL